MAAIDRKSSIETEPRTLDIRQIEFAREAALYVVNTRSIEEAVQIFTEGMKPVTSVAQVCGDDATMGYDSEEECGASSARRNQHLGRVSSFRDVLTAPF